MSSDTLTKDRRRVPLRTSIPTRGERIPALASQLIGGPLGSRAVVGARGWRPAAAILSALSSVFVALGVVQKNHCVTSGWATPGSLWRECYSDLPVAVASPGGSSPWSDPTIGGQPPLTAIVTWFVRMLVPDGSQLRLQQGMFAWGAAVIAILIALAVTATAAAMPRGPWVAAHVALSPVLITVSLVSFDALAVALMAGGLLAWHRSRYLLSGTLLMCAFLSRPALGVALLACLVVALQRRRYPAFRDMALAGVATACIVLGVAAAWGGDAFASFTIWHEQPASYGSVWFLFALAGFTLSPSGLSLVACVGWLGALAVGWSVARAERNIGPEPIATVMLVIVLLTSRAVPVQAALWFLPLLALSAVKWRDHLIWVGVELTYFALLWTFVARDSNMAKALPEGWYAAVTGARIVAQFYIARAAMVASTDLEPEPLLEAQTDRAGIARERRSAQDSSGSSGPGSL